jgi:hypothetical protein
MVKNNEVCPESDGKTDKKEKTHQIIANPLVSRKAQVTPRSSERIRKVKRKPSAATRERKKRTKTQKIIKHIQERKPAGTSMVITWEVKKEKHHKKRPLSLPGAALLGSWPRETQNQNRPRGIW